MPNEDLNTMIAGLGEEPVPVIDYDAPEAGSFPPLLTPGEYEFLLRMPEKPEDWFGSIEVEVVKGQPKKKFPQIIFEADAVGKLQAVQMADQTTQQELVTIPAREDGSQPRLRFCRASFFKSDKMPNSQAAEFIRSLGYRLDINPSAGWAPFLQAVKDMLASADGRVRFKAEVAWRSYFKATQTTVATNPSRKRGDIPWPKDAQGNLLDLAQDPKSGAKQYANAEIVRFRLPQAAK